MIEQLKESLAIQEAQLIFEGSIMIHQNHYIIWLHDDIKLLEKDYKKIKNSDELQERATNIQQRIDELC